MARFDAVVFDLDGTLVHSSPDIAHHLNAAFASCLDIDGPFQGHDVEMMIGGGLKAIIEKGFNALSIDPHEDLFDQVLMRYRDGYLQNPVINTHVYDGVIEMLNALQADQIKIGLCTNKPENAARKVLNHFNLTAYFDAIIGGDTTATRKPEPESLEAAMEIMGVSPEKTVMVGDSKADYGAARKANCQVILVDWGYSAVDIHSLGGDAVISDYHHFNQTLAKI